MRELQFDDMLLFSRVAELGTLSAVARERDVPVSQISRALARIEKTCGARLIHRSTHGLAPTPEGETFLQYCRRLTGTLDELEGEFASQAREPTGRVRIASSTVIAQYVLVPSFEGLSQRHPGLRLELQVEDRMVDMAREGIDIAIRTGTPSSDTVVARQIGVLARQLYAAPDYLKTHGMPRHPDDLLGHRLITNNAVAQLNRWPFFIKGKSVTFVADGHYSTDSTSIAQQLALQGLGIARISSLTGEALARSGALVPVLAEFVDPQPSPIYAVTLSSRHRLPKIKACIDHWVDWFGKMMPA